MRSLRWRPILAGVRNPTLVTASINKEQAVFSRIRFVRQERANKMLGSNNAREALQHAQGNLAAAEAALQAARATTSRARAMLEEIVREGERLEADGRRAADALADKIRGAIAAGASPPAGDMSKSAARSDLDARRAMVERIVADFAAAEHEAELALSGATAVVERAVQDVLRSEVETIASRWATAIVRRGRCGLSSGAKASRSGACPGSPTRPTKRSSPTRAMPTFVWRRAGSCVNRGKIWRSRLLRALMRAPTSPTRIARSRNCEGSERIVKLRMRRSLQECRSGPRDEQDDEF
jgi:hypothetical protein